MTEQRKHWFRLLKKAGPGTDNEYYCKKQSVWFSDLGDGIYLMDIGSNRENSFAARYCELMNAILSDDAIRELVARRLEELEDERDE